MACIKMIAVGKLKEPWWQKAQSHYLKQITKRHFLEMVEVPDLQAGENLSPKEEEQIKNQEGHKILEQITHQDYVVAMDLLGELWQKKGWKTQTGVDALERGVEKKQIVFVIGGSLGLSQEVLARANKKICFSAMTFPHQLFRILLLEQLAKSV